MFSDIAKEPQYIARAMKFVLQLEEDWAFSENRSLSVSASSQK